MLPSSIAVAIASEAVLLAAATAWFGDPGRALVPLAPLVLILVLAAVVLRLCDSVARLRALYRPVLIAGIIGTSLVLIHARVFPALAANDWSWLASFANITNVYAEQPHTELGLIALSVVLWLFAERIVQNAGEYEQRRNAFLRLFAVMVGAVIVGIWSAQGNGQLSVALALLLPGYVLCGLLMMGQVRLAEIRARMMRAGNADRRSLGIWHLVTAGLIAVTLLLVFVATGIFYGGAYSNAITAFADALGAIIDLVALVFGVLTAPFVALLSNLFVPRASSSTSPLQTCRLLPTITPQPTTGGPVPTPIPQGNNTHCTPTGQQPTFLSAATNHEIYAAILFIVLVGVALFLLLRRLWQRDEQPPEEYEEFREALTRREKLAAPRPAPTLVAEPVPAGSVRAVYRDFLQRGAQIGLAREADETPAEYAARVQPLLKMLADDPPAREVTALTDAYEEERYGAVAPTPGRLAQAQAALKRIAATLGNMVRARN